jgi:AcrR family transcriptional regulator
MPAMSARTGEGETRRRRRTRDVARGEILVAAEELLRDQPFRELRVEELMSRTSMSRSSFYVYFRDRHELLLQLVQQIGDEMFEVADRWYQGSGDGRTDLRDGLDGVVRVYARHGRVMRAISDAATTDPEVEGVYGELIQRFVIASQARIAQEPIAGPADQTEMAIALVLMTERYLSQTLGAAEPRVTPDVAAEALHAVWTRTLYG